jgi:hypothetical protein
VLSISSLNLLIVGLNLIREINMKSVLSAVSLALATVMPLGTEASELKPLQAGTFVLGAQSVSIYYTVNGDTYEVVTTIAPDAGGAGAPVRFVGFLQPGQKALVSAGHFGATAEPETLELVHQGNMLSATPVTNVAAAN